MAKKKAKKAIKKIKTKKRINKPKKLDYQTGKQTPKGEIIDSEIQAKKPGKRKSARGKIYYERRANRSDRGKLLGVDMFAIRDNYEKALKLNVDYERMLKNRKAPKKELMLQKKHILILRKKLREQNQLINSLLK